MIELLNDIVWRTRQHHGIEHATIHVLSTRFPNRHFSGVSDPLGFSIYGDVGEESLRHAVGDALLRLQAGENDLAIHPNCGTNLATSAVMATVAALIGGGGRRRGGLERFTTALILVVLSLILAKSWGFRVQAYTTTAEVSDRWVADIRPFSVGSVQGYRVLFD